MITCKLEGGLGNQLFMISHVFAYAKKHHLNYCVETKVTNPHIYDKDEYHLSAYRFPGINYCSGQNNLQEYKENGFRYQEIPTLDNISFVGFWQSWKYFDEYRKELLNALDFPYTKNEGVVSIHVRRGDYLHYQNHHPVITIEYLNRAIYFFMQRGYFKFRVFSDDLKWCKENIPAQNIELEFSEGQEEIQDLVDASCCEHSIGSNSSYSWWIYYLNQNKNKIGVFPRQWFGPALNHDISDLLPANTIML